MRNGRLLAEGSPQQLLTVHSMSVCELSMNPHHLCLGLLECIMVTFTVMSAVSEDL